MPSRFFLCTLTSFSASVTAFSFTFIWSTRPRSWFCFTLTCSLAEANIASQWCMTGAVEAVQVRVQSDSISCRASSNAVSASVICSFSLPAATSLSDSCNNSFSTSLISGCISGKAATSSGRLPPLFRSRRTVLSCLKASASCIGVRPAASGCSIFTRRRMRRSATLARPAAAAACNGVCFSTSSAWGSAPASSNFCVTVTCPLVAAQASGVRPSSAVESTSARCAIKASAASKQPRSAAVCSGVRFPLARAPAFALFVSSNSTTVVCPRSTAVCRGVALSCAA
mmetsp:Transcript_76467/g.224408  ORF Transcript_76467/g.224408 Transcript_76467/m.224408 type:complete len:284 (+) Transcript_76467:531-1382(+)